MFVGSDFSGHHFKASDAYETWENKNVDLSQTSSQEPLKNWFQDVWNPRKTEYGDLRRNYANLRRNYAYLRRKLGISFACVYYCWTALFGFLVASIKDC